jgi:hypothetical protein
MWAAEQAAPQFGGYLAFRPYERLHLQLFSDHSGRGQRGLVQLDHVIGWMALVPFHDDQRWLAAASLGSCVDFRTWRDRDDGQLAQADVLFGPRLGLNLERRLDAWWSAQLNTTGILYVGNGSGTYGWGQLGPGLSAHPVFEVQVGVTRWIRFRRGEG